MKIRSILTALAATGIAVLATTTTAQAAGGRQLATDSVGHQ
ncbi:hypothetical protein [Embleya sp. NPDC020630]